MGLGKVGNPPNSAVYAANPVMRQRAWLAKTPHDVESRKQSGGPLSGSNLEAMADHRGWRLAQHRLRSCYRLVCRPAAHSPGMASYGQAWRLGKITITKPISPLSAWPDQGAARARWAGYWLPHARSPREAAQHWVDVRTADAGARIAARFNWLE